MPAQSTITLGVSLLTLGPLGKTGNIASYSDDSAVSVAVEPTLTVSSTRPSKTSKLSKVRMKLVIPQSTIVDGVPTGIKAREASVDVTFLFHESCTDAERIALADNFRALLNNDDIDSVVSEGKTIY